MTLCTFFTRVANYLIWAVSFLPFTLMAAQPANDLQSPDSITVIDKRNTITPRYLKFNRQHTLFIIVHTSEAPLESTLLSILKGKRLPGKKNYTRGGHAHYIIDPGGEIHYTLDHKYIADHAGQSMWKGETDLSKVSVGIELVGTTSNDLTSAQYHAIGHLIDTLQDQYGLDDLAVLTHSQVAFGSPNTWFDRNHRGRKLCAQNFDRGKAGLGPTLPIDPDVAAGRLLPDKKLAAVFYGRTPGSVEKRTKPEISRIEYNELALKKIRAGEKLVAEGKSFHAKAALAAGRIDTINTLLELVQN